MIQINLLPHREEKRKLRKQAFFVGIGLSVAVGAVLVVLFYAFQQQLIVTQLGRNEFLQQANARLDEQIKDVSELRAEIDALKARQKSVEDLQTDRNMPVYLLNELSRQSPDGLFIRSIQQAGQSVLINGVAQSNERVSEFLRNTNNNSPWFERPELLEIKSAQIALGDAKKTTRLFDFSLRLGLKRPQVAAAAGVKSAASASAPLAKP